MQRADQHTQQQIADLVNACAGYWELRGIERARNNEMQLELEQHLQQAVHDGKSLEAVLGPNPLGFAEAWAREMHPRFWRGGARCLSGLVYVLSIVSTTALISQLLSRAPAFTLSIFAAYLLTGSGCGKGEVSAQARISSICSVVRPRPRYIWIARTRSMVSSSRSR